MKKRLIVTFAAIVLLGVEIGGCSSTSVAGVPSAGEAPAAHDATPSYAGSSTPEPATQVPEPSAEPVTPPAVSETAASETVTAEAATDVAASGTAASSEVRPAIVYPFDGPPVVDETWFVSWGDSMFDDDFVLTAPDDGNGHWQHRQVSSGCLIDFWQVRDTRLATDEGDRSLSDWLLAQLAGVDVDAVSSTAGDNMLPVMVPGGAHAFQTRAIYGTDQVSGEGLLYEARVFSGAAAGVAVGVRCPAGIDVSDSSKLSVLSKVSLTIVQS